MGESISQGVYRITFDPVEGMFDSVDVAHDAAAHSCWNVDSEFGSYKVELARTTVLVNEYPFICKGCTEFVSNTKNGKCGNCGGVEWEARDECQSEEG